jgi:hypothetical protein
MKLVGYNRGLSRWRATPIHVSGLRRCLRHPL